MKKLLFALIGLLLAVPALSGIAGAGDFYPGERVNRQSGWHVPFPAPSTNQALDPGFTADWVRICIQSTTGQVVYIREGKTLAEATTDNTGAVTAAFFASGDTGNIEGRAYVIGNTITANNEPVCETIPWRVDGLVLHTPNTGTVSADVVFFDTFFPDGRW
jgi:hypothetical protein